MSKWEMMRLGDVSELITKGTTPTTLGFNFVDSGISFVKIESISNDGTFIKEKFQHIDEKCNLKLKRSQLQKDDILFSIAGALGRTAIVTEEILPANTNQALAIIRIIRKDIYLNYILTTLKSNFIFKQFQKQKQGVAQLNLSLKNIADFKIPLPPIEEQRKIADTLDKVSDIIKLYKEQLAELDSLIQSVFYDMFGDPVTNEKGWRVKTFANVCKVRQGLQIPISNRMKENGENRYEYITIQYLNGKKEKEYIENPKQNVICTKEDVLMTRTGNTGLVVTNTQGVFHNNFFLIDFNRNILGKIYLVCYLKLDVVKSELLLRAGNSTIPDLNHSEFYKIKIPVPPLPLQNQFATIVTKIEQQKTEVQKALDDAQMLFDSLMQEYFE